jgi:two-component system response regulator HydG
METKILIVEDQFIEANNLRLILRKAGYTVCSVAASVQEALSIIKNEKPDLVLLDIHLQGKLTGIDLAKILNERNIAFVFLSANSNKKTLDAAKATMPYGFLVKPFREKDILVSLDVAWYLHRQNHTAAIQHRPQPRVLSNNNFKEIIAASPNMLAILEHVKIAGPSDISVLILGESGTGKELVAQNIHQISPRANKPFIAINCATIPVYLIESELFGHEKGAFTGASDKRVGKFEQANEGTVFLDEIGELPIDLQVKLLRVLQEREVEPIGGKKRKIDVRVIAATNRILEEEIAARRFRLDLYYRLNVFSILLPPLRERKADILALANHFILKYAQKENNSVTKIANSVVKKMLDHTWPGNIRELENAIARSVLFATSDTINDMQFINGQNLGLPRQSGNYVKTMDENERDYILDMIEKCNGKVYGVGGAAEAMNINVSTLKSRMKKLGIDKKKTAEGC